MEVETSTRRETSCTKPMRFKVVRILPSSCGVATLVEVKAGTKRWIYAAQKIGGGELEFYHLVDDEWRSPSPGPNHLRTSNESEPWRASMWASWCGFFPRETVGCAAIILPRSCSSKPLSMPDAECDTQSTNSANRSRSYDHASHVITAVTRLSDWLACSLIILYIDLLPLFVSRVY